MRTQLFAADLPDHGRSSNHGSHAPSLVNAPRAGGKKKSSSSSAYDPNNPYASKPSKPSKPKAWGKNHSHSSSHSNSSQGSSSQMGIVGQAPSIAGLAAAYALPPSSERSQFPPRTPSHDGHMNSHALDRDLPPRTPHEGSSSVQFGLEAHPYASNSMRGSVLEPSPHFGGHLHGGKLQSSSNYTGGQYAKYGKRY